MRYVRKRRRWLLNVGEETSALAEKLRLKIITPQKFVYDGEVEELVAPGELGEFGILPGHVPFLSVLFPGRLRLISGDREDVLIIHGGLADVKDNTVSILTDRSEKPEDVDILAAKKDAEILQRQLDENSSDGDLLQRAELDKQLRIARARAGEQI